MTPRVPIFVCGEPTRGDDAAGLLVVRRLPKPGRVRVAEPRPAEPVLELASQKGIPVFTTKLGMFEACGILYATGLKGAM